MEERKKLYHIFTEISGIILATEGLISEAFENSTYMASFYNDILDLAIIRLVSLIVTPV